MGQGTRRRAASASASVQPSVAEGSDRKTVVSELDGSRAIIKPVKPYHRAEGGQELLMGLSFNSFQLDFPQLFDSTCLAPIQIFRFLHFT